MYIAVQRRLTRCRASQCIYFSQCSVVFSQVQVLMQFIKLTGQYASWILQLNPQKCEFLCREMLIREKYGLQWSSLNDPHLYLNDSHSFMFEEKNKVAEKPHWWLTLLLLTPPFWPVNSISYGKKEIKFSNFQMQLVNCKLFIKKRLERRLVSPP